MILPSKHLSFSKSLLGYGSYLIKKIGEGKGVDDLYLMSQQDYKRGLYPSKQSFDSLMLTLVFLYSIGVVEEHEGVVVLCA
jgi:hypothetical protein